jgi:hypothetical protein
MKTIKIEWDAKGTGCWLALDDVDLPDGNAGNVKVDRDAGLHLLTWWMIGKPGDKIKIDVSVAGVPAGKVDTKIPAGDEKIAGVLPVEVK